MKFIKYPDQKFQYIKYQAESNDIFGKIQAIRSLAIAMLVYNSSNGNERNNNAGYMQSPNHVRTMRVEANIYKLPDLENPVLQHILGVNLKKPVNIMNMAKDHQPVGSLQ